MPDKIKENAIKISAFLLLLTSLFFCLCSGVMATTFTLADTETDFVDTSIFTPEMSILVALSLLIPAILIALTAIGIWFFFDVKPVRRRALECEAALDRLREVTLQIYLDQMSQLMLDKELRTLEAESGVRQQTLIILQELDGRRKEKLLQFLLESNLITDQQMIELNQVDLSHAERKIE